MTSSVREIRPAQPRLGELVALAEAQAALATDHTVTGPHRPQKLVADLATYSSHSSRLQQLPQTLIAVITYRASETDQEMDTCVVALPAGAATKRCAYVG